MNINQVWPEWNEDCVLGEGSFGKVYKAKRVEYGRTFYSAIKEITVPKNQQEIKHARSQGMNDTDIYLYFQSIVDNLLNEITLMNNLKGAKNIVGIEDYKIVEREGEIGWDVFIRMELLTPFDSFISNPEFSQKDVIRLGVDICTALEVCEQNNIIHRDIKPDNIFVSRFGEYKLGDFGIARKLEVTQANLSRKGTLNYMAPEVYKSEGYGSSVDVYSLGLVLYTLLNNNRTAFLPPYPQTITYKDNEEALSKRLSGVPLTPPCNASMSLGATILKACAYWPQERYQSATEFKNALIAEWNTLVQSRDNREIASDAMRFSNNLEQQFQSTTNDMTANGRLVVEEYDQGTTVLTPEMMSYNTISASQDGTYAPVENNKDIFKGNINVAIPTAYSKSKSSKLCRVLAWPLAITTGILGLVLLFQNAQVPEKSFSFALIGISLSILLSDRSKIAIALCTISLSLPYITDGLSVLLNGLQDEMPVFAVIEIVSGLLALFSGIVTVSQKEVRFGGSLCVYAIVIEWAYNIYCLINGDASFEMWHISFGIAVLSVFVWSYGYKSDESLDGIKKILGFVTLAISGIVGLTAVIFLIKAVPLII